LFFVLWVLYEAEWAMYDAFLFELEQDKFPEIIENLDDEEVLATYIADKVEAWIKKKLATSMDKMVWFGLHFVNVT
jgi:hypothetical protein